LPDFFDFLVSFDLLPDAGGEGSSDPAANALVSAGAAAKEATTAARTINLMRWIMVFSYRAGRAILSGIVGLNTAKVQKVPASPVWPRNFVSRPEHRWMTKMSSR
jgi:hypothetical protein